MLINLSSLDSYIYEILERNHEKMPIRFVKWVANFYPDARIRKLYFSRLGVHMGENTYANLGMRVVTDEINEDIKVRIGDNVSIAPNATFVADSCPNNGNEINQIQYVSEHLTTKGKIVVEDEVWIGANVTILPNVRIGRCSVIGAGSVVTKDIEPYTVYAGVPAKKIRDLK